VLALTADGQARQVGTIPAAVHGAGAAIIDGVVMLYGGASVSPFDLIQEWSSGPGLIVGHLSDARSGDAVALLDGKVYVAGGYDGLRLVRSIVTSSTGFRLSEVGQLAQGVEGGAMASWRDSIWMIGGTGSLLETGLPVDTNLIQRFYPRTGVTSVVGHLPAPVSNAVPVVLGDQLFVVGGERAGTPVDEIWRIDERGGSTLVGHLPEGRSRAALVVVGDHTAWLVGGLVPQGPTASVVVLDGRA
jgi:N-acetylneuraminic acid mutarotase